MRVQTAAIMLVSLSTPGLLAASCPPEVKEVRDLLTAKAATASTVRPKSQASARGQDTQAPHGQEIQAPRGQDVQAPRGQDIQAPRGQETEAPRNVAKGRSTALINARRLVNEAEAACKDNDSERAASNARAARELLRYLP
jgi:hypothetical protein